MKRKQYKSKISKKAFSPFPFKSITKDEIEGKFISKEGKSVQKTGKKKIFRVSSERTYNGNAVIGYCNLRNIKNILKKYSGKNDELMKYLNEFISEMAFVVRREGGGVNKFSDNGFYFYFLTKREEKTAENKIVETVLKLRAQMNKLNRKWDFYWTDSWQVGFGLIRGHTIIKNYDDKLGKSHLVENDVSNMARYLSNYTSAGQVLINDNFYQSPDLKDKDYNISKSRHLALRETGKTVKIYEIIGKKGKYSR